MMDINSILIWHQFNNYSFDDVTHSYYYNGSRVQYSVTQFIKRFHEEFDSETISKKYAEKNGLNHKDVLLEWDRKGRVSAEAGTIIHSYLENAKRGKQLNINYSTIDQSIREDVMNRVNILLPQAQQFHKDTLNRLYPIQLEYTVGIEDVVAGNIDLLCWNKRANEFQIWDYKNLKEFTTTNYFHKHMLGSFRHLPECHLSKYSIQLNMYKAILQRKLGIPIGKCYLVHFDYVSDNATFQIHECLDLQRECNIELDKLIMEVKNNEQ